jgi:hypothetical protein
MLRSSEQAEPMGDQLLSVWNLPRALKASLGPFERGRPPGSAILSLSRIQAWPKSAFRAQLRAFAIGGRSRNAIDSVDTHFAHAAAQGKGGSVPGSEIGVRLARRSTQREEAFLTNLADRIPGVEGI